MLPEAAGRGQHFQARGHSFSLYRPTRVLHRNFLKYIATIKEVNSTETVFFTLKLCNVREKQSPGQTIAACQRNIFNIVVGRNILGAFGYRVAMCSDMLGVVDSSLKIVEFEPTTPNTSQQGGQTHPTCCSQQCCADMLRSFGRPLYASLQCRATNSQTNSQNFKILTLSLPF